MTRNRKVIIAVAFGVLLVAAWSWWCSNPLHRSEASVRAWVLKRTPLGIGPDEVRTVADKHGWLLSSAYGAKRGFYIVGAVGDYWSLPFNTHVTGSWFFDDTKSNRLVYILIEKKKY